MLHPGDRLLAKEIQDKLVNFRKTHALPGISKRENFECLILQIIDSIRRVKYATVIRDKNISALCCDARSVAFDPLKAASGHRMNGNIDESFWLVFLATQFGKHSETKWELIKAIYGALQNASYWNWNRTSSNPKGFRSWLQKNRFAIEEKGEFSNHRSHETLEDNIAGRTIETYTSWIGGSHQDMINHGISTVGNNPRDLFDYLFNDMRVFHFGRLAKFDFLSMLGKLGIAQIEPGSTYLQGATGPLRGARLLFTGNKYSTSPDDETMNQRLNGLAEHCDFYFGMQVFEDAVCNWQKNPANYVHFSG